MDITREFAESPTTRYLIFYRDIMRTINFLINYLPFINNIYYVPERVYMEDDEGGIKKLIYSELYTADWWREI